MHTPQAWLRLDTMVVEKTDYLTGRNVRYLRVDTPDLPSSQLGSADGRVHTPPPRESAEDEVRGGASGSMGGVGGGGREKDGGKLLGVSGISGWAPPQTGTDGERLFGESSLGPGGGSGGMGREGKGPVSRW